MDARDTIAAARTKITRMLPYLASPVMALRPFPLDGLGTFGVDAESRMAFDPVTTLQWGVEYSASGVFHEALHVFGDHFGRQGNRDHETWNWACDTAINQILRDAGFQRPPGAQVLLPELFKFPPNLSPEEYYDLFQQSAKAKQQAGQMAQGGGGGKQGEGQPSKFPGSGAPCGTGAGNPQGWEDKAKELSGGIEGQDKADAKLMRRGTAEKIQAAAKRGGRGQGTVPAGLEAWAKLELRPPEIPWQNVLASDIRSAVASRSGADDYTRARFSRRYWGLRQSWGPGCPVLPALRSPRPDVAVVVDTSGSMTGDPIERAMAEVLGVVKAIGLPVRAYAVDAAVQAVARVMSARDVEKLNVGGGGTDMVVGIQAADAARPDVIIVISDGLTGWPDPGQMPHAKLVVAVIGDAAVPAHIRKVVRVPRTEKAT